MNITNRALHHVFHVGLSAAMHLDLVLFCLFCALGLQAQQTVNLSGQIRDSLSGTPLSYAAIKLDSNHVGTMTDEKGYFHLHGLCVGQHHICISYIGYPQKCFKVVLHQDETIIIELEGQGTELEAVEVDRRAMDTLAVADEIGSASIAEQANGSLGDQLSNIAGVEVLRTGASIDKPIIHGLYGNRIAILNNGVALSAQQWGNDHAPEIDPMAANQIRVVKGVGSLAHMSSSLGAVVLIEPGRILPNNSMRGQLNYIFQSNGLGHTANLKLENYNPILPWRITESFKRMGDLSTARLGINMSF